MSKESDAYRLHMLRNLKSKYGQSDPPEVLEAKKVIAKFSKEQQDAGPQISRASLPFPKRDLCPACWIKEGHEVPLSAIRADDPDNFDRMRCNVCGYEEDRDARA